MLEMFECMAIRAQQKRSAPCEYIILLLWNVLPVFFSSRRRGEVHVRSSIPPTPISALSPFRLFSFPAHYFTATSVFTQLVVWTASGQAYADAIINMLDPDRTLFAARLYRDSCTRHRGLCVKDLRRLGRPMDSIILLDNFVYSFGFTLNNGIPITPWTGTQVQQYPPLFI